MILRIVRMEFRPENVRDFLELFHRSKDQIRNFRGVSKLELLRDAESENVYYTYSIWINSEALEAYRQSALFKEIWSKTKELFEHPAQAFSMVRDKPEE